jgi:putative sterol carrier protein
VITDDATEFFDQLARRGHEPLLNSVSGTVRFDLVDGPRTDHWYVRIKKGDMKVGQQEMAADTIVRVDKDVFLAMTEGRVNAVAAFLRGELALDGDVGLVISFQRLLPGPPTAGRAG